MPIKIKNWKLALLAFIFIGLFVKLGLWQVARADEKKILLASYHQRMQQKPLTAFDLTHSNDWRFYQAQLHGYFDNQHTILLDNKTFQGRVGYEVYTPFKAQGLTSAVLVDRGFVPLKSRDQLPTIRAVNGPLTITGLINVPPKLVTLGAMMTSTKLSWPLSVESLQLAQLANMLNYPLFPYTVSLAPQDPNAYPIEWQIVIMGPEKHMGYAVQWFALALTLLILFAALGLERKKHIKKVSL